MKKRLATSIFLLYKKIIEIITTKNILLNPKERTKNRSKTKPAKAAHIKILCVAVGAVKTITIPVRGSIVTPSKITASSKETGKVNFIALRTQTGYCQNQAGFEL